jgi:hypothetical protein
VLEQFTLSRAEGSGASHLQYVHTKAKEEVLVDVQRGSPGANLRPVACLTSGAAPSVSGPELLGCFACCNARKGLPLFCDFAGFACLVLYILVLQRASNK